MIDLKTLEEDLGSLTLLDYRTPQKDDKGIYIGFDVDETEDGMDAVESYLEYIQDELRDLGYQLTDVSLEHDYIGGYIVEYNPLSDTELLEFIFKHWQSQLFGELLEHNLNRGTLTAFINDEDNKACDYE